MSLYLARLLPAKPMSHLGWDWQWQVFTPPLTEDAFVELMKSLQPTHEYFELVMAMLRDA